MQVRRDIRPESRAIDSTLNTTAFQGTVIFDRCPQVAFLLHSSAHLARGSLAWRFCLSRCVRISKTSKSKLGTCRSEEHTSELQSQSNLVCRLLLEKKKENL